MARRPLIRTSDFPYHVTGRSNNKEWFYVPMMQCWDAFEEVLIATEVAYGIELHSFVLMSNHFHLTVSTPNKNLDEAMRYLLTEVSRRLRRISNRINHIFGNRYKWSVLTNPVAWSYVYKYVYRNPVTAGISPSCLTYPYSTLHKLYFGHCRLPIVEGTSALWKWIPKDPVEKIDWLDKPTPRELERLVALGLRRYEFQFSSRRDLQFKLRKLASHYLVPEAVDQKVPIYF